MKILPLWKAPDSRRSKTSGVKWAGSLALLFLLLAVACGTTGSEVTTGSDAAEVEAVDTAPEPDTVILAEVGVTDQAEPPEVIPEDSEELPPAGCEDGEGCFGAPCTGNEDCQSGWCVEHLGDGTCTQACQEECPPGWTCKLLAGTGPDPVYVCLSAFANLCKPCASDDDCIGPGGQQDACLSYGEEGSFCGGGCSPENDDSCPWGFSCKSASTVDGIELSQCVAEAGICPCSAKSVALGLWTPCEITGEWGACPGKRVCTEEGLTPCDASQPAQEECNGLDDDCDGDTDEPIQFEGDWINLCDDGNDCTDDSCLGTEGCHTEPLDGGECADGDACTVGDHCEEAVCVGNPVVCDDLNPCTDDACDGLGGCSFTPNEANCDDGNPCTVADRCEDEECVGVTVPCDCQEDVDCLALEDGDACSGTLYCSTEVWPYECDVDAGTVVVCPEPEPGPDAICLAASCHPETGACSLIPDHEGMACEDSNACTIGDKCQAGSCVAGTALNCADDNPCTDDGCDPQTGCTQTSNTAACQDGNACTAGDHCVEGVCIAGEEMTCDDANACTADSCDSALGCIFTPTPGECDDGNLCTTGDHCEDGKCLPSGSLECDDDDVCTDDSCDPQQGCLVTLNEAPCDDGNLCTTGDHCHLGECIHSGELPCTDGNPCTADSCQAASGCIFEAITGDCDDSNLCTEDDHCAAGLCVGSKMVQCNDNNPCTDESCEPDTGCVYEENTAPCNDDNQCTLQDQCQGGVCVGSGSPSCNDDNPCTDDSCEPDKGCVHQDNQDGCEDGNLCTEGDFCQNGECIPGPAPDCGDDNICTDDSCEPDAGCVHPNNQAACDDGNLCTEGDSCLNGECTPGPAPDCNDDNVCTDDSCEPDAGCVHDDNEEPCPGGTCSGGICVSACEPIFYGTAGIGVNNGWTCVNVCAVGDGVSVDWDGAEEQMEYCHELHPGAEIFIKDPHNFSYPIWEVQHNRCKLNKDGQKGQNFAGNGTPQYGDQILCKCQKDCPCVPNCAGKNCGDDGCGGSCGGCDQDCFCDEGQCNCDKVVTIQPPEADVRIISYNPTSNYAAGSQLYLNVLPQGPQRLLIRFALPPLQGSVESATLACYVAEKQGETGLRTYYAYRLTQSWEEESVTWNSRSAGQPWNNPGGAFSLNDSASIPGPENTGIWMEWDVTAMVSSWVAGDNSNHGFLLKDNTEVSTSEIYPAFPSKDSNKPVEQTCKLVISYAP